MKIAIFGQAYKTDSLQYIVDLLEFLSTKQCETLLVEEVSVLVQSELSTTVKTFKSSDIEQKDIDYMISVGGDGTMLRAASIIRDSNIPVIGINTGRLGFLATIQKENMATAINQLFEGNFHINKRSLLEVSTNKKDDGLEIDFALNEVSVSRKNTTTMIMINTYLDEEFLNSYWADGLIVATPTGSTGYSLSCNGPIVSPEVKAVVLTPISPHNLSQRPLIIKDTMKIKLLVESREDKYLLSMDSRIVSLETDTEVNIKKADFQLHMIELDKQSFYKTLREKLLWGKDNRN